MKVQELIDLLNEVENKDASVYFYKLSNGRIVPVEKNDIDISISDRVDINIF